MNHRKKVADCRASPRRLKAGIACLALGMLAGCGGGGDGDGAIGAAGGALQAAQTTVVERIDPIVQSGQLATMKLAEKKCAKRARTEAGDGADRKSMRQSARKEACEAEHQSQSHG